LESEAAIWGWVKPTPGRRIRQTGHGTQKPVECMRRPILAHTRRGDAVYDPFVGSGSTIIAAEQVGRRCLAMELDPIYVDVAIRRWQDFSGNSAVLDADGRNFRKVTAERVP
jgi:DNA modification methylase